MTFRSLMATAALLICSSYAHSALAIPITSFTGQTITTSDASQLGRPSRNSQPQTWTGVEAYPGVLASSANTTYYYKTFTISNSLFNPNNYLDISFTDTDFSGLLFISAYANSYNPNARGQNWLGDLGYNSIAYGVDSLTFDVVSHPGDNLVLVVNTTGGGVSGTGHPFDIYVTGYTDTMYDDVTPTPYVAPAPEPSTWVELGTGLLAMAGMARRRFLNS